MMKKQISKITMMASLLVASAINAQEFYTCVPKKSWWVDTMSESIRNSVPSANAIAKAVNNPKNKPSTWKFVREIESGSIELQSGKYKIMCSSWASWMKFDYVFFEVTFPSYLSINKEDDGNSYFMNMAKRIALFLPFCKYLYVLE